jgi:hypothetical protein
MSGRPAQPFCPDCLRQGLRRPKLDGQGYCRQHRNYRSSASAIKRVKNNPAVVAGVIYQSLRADLINAFEERLTEIANQFAEIFEDRYAELEQQDIHNPDKQGLKTQKELDEEENSGIYDEKPYISPIDASITSMHERWKTKKALEMQESDRPEWIDENGCFTFPHNLFRGVTMTRDQNMHVLALKRTYNEGDPVAAEHWEAPVEHGAALSETAKVNARGQ